MHTTSFTQRSGRATSIGDSAAWNIRALTLTLRSTLLASGAFLHSLIKHRFVDLGLSAGLSIFLQAMRKAERVSFRIGAAVSSSSNTTYIFFSNDTVPKGGNLIATVLLMLLRAIKSAGDEASRATVLEIQMDCGPENINR